MFNAVICDSRLNRLGQYWFDNLPVYVGQTEIATLEPVRQLSVVKAEQMQNGCMQVMHVDFILGNIEAERVGLTQRDTRFDAAAG